MHVTRQGILLVCLSAACVCAAQSLPGTAPLEGTNALADAYMSGLDRFMLRATGRLAEARDAEWRARLAAPAPEAEAWIATNRQILARLLGVRDARVPFDAPEPVGTLASPAVLGETPTHTLLAIRWPVIGDFYAEGLLLEPRAKPVVGCVVHLPHAGVAPEQVLGLTPGLPAGASGFSFPAPGCRMLIPATVSRAKRKFESAVPNPFYGKQTASMPGGKVMTAREFVYRPAYVMGRHLIGYEIQEVLALVDWFAQESPAASVRVEGWGDGGLLALEAAALDARIGEAVVAGAFGNRDRVWQEPVDRNVFGLLRHLGGAELAALVAPRRLTVLAVPGPSEAVTREKGEGGAPGELVSPPRAEAEAECARARRMLEPLGREGALTLADAYPRADTAPLHAGGLVRAPQARLPEAAAREGRLVRGMDAFSQRLLAVSPATRRAFLSRLDLSSAEAYDRSAAAYRAYYRDEVMGRIEGDKLPLRPRSRLVEETSDYVCHEVLLDVLPDFVLTGYLLVPKNIPAGELRPVIVAQHGRGGSPQTLMSLAKGGRPTYHEIAPRLAAKGYIVFLPQNPYIFEDRCRQLARKANPLKWTLYSVVLAQYEQMFAWFATLPQADCAKVAFVGQSYGGKTAVRVPPVMPEFCLSISTGDFNEGVTKMASTLHPFSFALWDEYEIFEFDFGSTFNYSDLAGLMAPRPFMAQRGHADGVAWDEYVGYEYALVRRLYTQLKIPERTEIRWFDGGHEIDVEAAIEFFDRFLRK